MSALADAHARRMVVLPDVHPKGWEPGTASDGKNFSGIARRPADQEVDHAELLSEWGFHPTRYHIREGSLQFRTWEGSRNGLVQKYRYYKANIDGGALLGEADLKELIKFIEKPLAKARLPLPVGDDAFVICLSDWQIGKGSGGGTPATVTRLKRNLELAVVRIAELRKAGKPLGKLCLLGLGDISEQCFGHYSSQVFTVDLNRRDQEKTCRQLIVLFIRTLAPLFTSVEVVVVGGNHGENRGGPEGKAFTDDADNSDVSLFETVSEQLAENSSYDHVSFLLPNDELSLSVEMVPGIEVGIAHGHQFRKGTTAQQKAREWWKGQTFGLQPVSNALILVSAHFHHFSVVEHGPRTHFQTPACDGGSKWFRDSTGEDSATGLLTFRVTASSPTGWDSVEVLREIEEAI